MNNCCFRRCFMAILLLLIAMLTSNLLCVKFGGIASKKCILDRQSPLGMLAGLNYVFSLLDFIFLLANLCGHPTIALVETILMCAQMLGLIPVLLYSSTLIDPKNHPGVSVAATGLAFVYGVVLGLELIFRVIEHIQEAYRSRAGNNKTQNGRQCPQKPQKHTPSVFETFLKQVASGAIEHDSPPANQSTMDPVMYYNPTNGQVYAIPNACTSEPTTIPPAPPAYTSVNAYPVQSQGHYVSPAGFNNPNTVYVGYTSVPNGPMGYEQAAYKQGYGYASHHETPCVGNGQIIEPTDVYPPLSKPSSRVGTPSAFKPINKPPSHTGTPSRSCAPSRTATPSSVGTPSRVGTPSTFQIMVSPKPIYIFPSTPVANKTDASNNPTELADKKENVEILNKTVTGAENITTPELSTDESEVGFEQIKIDD